MSEGCFAGTQWSGLAGAMSAPRDDPVTQSKIFRDIGVAATHRRSESDCLLLETRIAPESAKDSLGERRHAERREFGSSNPRS